MRPQAGTYPAYFGNYIQQVAQDDVNEALKKSWTEVHTTFAAIPENKADFAYAPGKWTVKQMLNHLMDAERIFAYRALRFARKDPQQLSSFEEDDYAAAADVSKRSLKDLLEEFEALRKSNIFLFRSFSESTLLCKGRTPAGEVTVLALGFLMSGHCLHHLRVLKERYL